MLLDGGIGRRQSYTAPRMQPKLKRSELDELAGHFALDESGVDTLLEVAGARPGREANLQFLARMLRLGGVLSLAAGLVFFVAANWSRFAVFGRFALVELLLVGGVIAALLRPPPAPLGRAALFLAFVATGALLALFGQTYQTGADVYELFLTWALLGLPLAALSQWSATSAAWVLVLNTALLLFCGWQPAGGLLWAALGGRHFQPATLVIGITVLNVGLWMVGEYFDVAAVPRWVRHLTISCAFAFGTWAGIDAIVEKGRNAGVVLTLLAAMIAVFAYARRQRRDIYPLAVVLGTAIIVSTVWLGNAMEFNDEGVLLMLAIWLIGSSTVAGRLLTSTARRWREAGAA
jgi:uncharacterized membrane protein